MTNWAEIFGVSRVSIYDWLNEKSNPPGNIANKIRDIYKLVSTLPGKKNPILQTYLYQNINRYNKSLMDIFASSHDFEKEYQDLSKIVVVLINQSRKNRDRLIELAKNKKSKEEILNYNLKNLNL